MGHGAMYSRVLYSRMMDGWDVRVTYRNTYHTYLHVIFSIDFGGYQHSLAHQLVCVILYLLYVPGGRVGRVLAIESTDRDRGGALNPGQPRDTLPTCKYST